MKIEVQIDPSCQEPRILILTGSMTQEISDLMKRLANDVPSLLCGSRNGKIEVLSEEALIRMYAASGKIFAVTDRGEYVLHLRLCDLEEKLDPRFFVRISHSEIINLRNVIHFDLSFAGTICVKLSNGEKSYVSRRYVPKIKKILGI